MTYYVAMSFIPMDHGLGPADAVECPTEMAAIRRAEAISRHEATAGAGAFSRSGDPNLGDFEDAVILKTLGDVPEDFRQV